MTPRSNETCCRIIYFVFILACCLSQIPAAFAQSGSRPAFLDQNTSYLWPTNASRYMSSSFGETRAAHFHAAIDIGTWGREGYPVFATRDGIVYRVATGPVGYGNVIYMRHRDDSQSIYAHLKDFHPRIRKVVDSLRLENYRFDFDEVIESCGLHFEKGQQIGWTGSTGVGPPHLHFELRSPEGVPFNPLLAGIRIHDTIAPRYSGLAIEPLSKSSTINGHTRIHRLRPAYSGGKAHFGTIEAEGEIGLAVNVFDRANASNNVHAVYEIQLYVNDELYFHSRADSFSYAHARKMFIDRIYPILRSERRGYQRLYIRDGNNLPFYQDTGRNGRLLLEPGLHHVRIEASDFFGNRSSAFLRIHVLESKPVKNRTLSTFPDGYIQPDSMFVFKDGRTKRQVPDDLPLDSLAQWLRAWHWNKNWVYPPGDRSKTGENNFQPAVLTAIQPLGSYRQEKKSQLFSNQGLSLDLADRMRLTSGSRTIDLYRYIPGHPLSVQLESMRIRIDFPENAFFEPLTIAMQAFYPDLLLIPGSEPMNRPARIQIILDEDLSEIRGLGIYRQDLHTGRLSFIHSEKDPSGNRISASVNRDGLYTLQIDSLPPQITSPRIARWTHNGRYYAAVSVEDDLSGVDYRSARFYVNGLRGIAEYDPEKKLLIFHHPDFTPQEVNEIRIRLSDRAGNLARITFNDMRYN